MYLDGIFDLVDIIKRKFRKRPKEQELDEYLDSETPGEHEYAEMPGELDQIAKYARGIHTDEQFEKLRKDL